MIISRAIEIVRSAAPEELQESWDNSGIQILTDAGKDIDTVLTCLEINDDVVEEAVSKGVDLIVTHHPLIFGSLTSLSSEDIVGGQIIKLISNGISVYSAHTSFDSARSGTNEDLARKLGLKETEPIEPAEADPDAGMGRTGVFENSLSFSDFLDMVRNVCGGNSFRIAGKIPESVSKVTICTGSGADFIDIAKASGSDVFITGDIKYHDARHISDIGFCAVDAGHFGTEVLFAENMAAQISEQAGDALKVLVSEVSVDPFTEL